MKTLGSVAVAVLFLSVLVAFAQDPVTVAPDQFKVRLENDKVRMVEYTSQKGDKIGMHSHFPGVIYVLKAGKTKFVLPNGKETVSEEKEGTVVCRSDPVTHSQETLEGPVHAIVIELK